MKRYWEEGRQGTGYRKMLLGVGDRWDLYLLHFPPGSSAPLHVDVVDGKDHFRLNLRLMGEDCFQAFLAKGPANFRVLTKEPGLIRKFLRGRLVVFRPDLLLHEVRPSDRDRYVLSLGFAS